MVTPPLKEGEVEVWTVFLPGLREAPWVSEEELRDAAQFRREDDRRRALVARGLARDVLARHAGVPPQAISFTRACAHCGSRDHGKPRVVAPAAAAQFRFNVSHAGDFVVLAVAAGREVGIDLERVDPTFEWAPVAERMFTPGERALLAEAPPAERLERFMETWTRKEAAVKLTGHGLATAPETVDVASPGGLPGVTIRSIAIGQGHVCSLAVEGGAPGVRIRAWPPVVTT